MRISLARRGCTSRVAVVLLAVGTLAPSSLGGCGLIEPSDEPGADAAADSGKSRPSGDAGEGSDSSLVPDYDGPSWDKPVPYPGVWRAVKGLPEGCGVRLSATPSTSIPSLEWAPCTSGEEGCQEARVAPGLGYVSFPENVTFHEDGRGAHVWVNVDGEDAKWSIMWNLSGPTEMVAHSAKGQGCTLSVGSSSRGYEMHASVYQNYRSHAYAVRAPHAEPLQTTVTTLSSALYLTGGLFWLGYGDDFVFTGSRIVPLEPGPSNPPLAPDLYSAGVLTAVQGGVLAVDSSTNAPNDVGYYPAKGRGRVVVLPLPKDRQVEYLAVDPTSGELIRVESEGPNYETVRLYASPVSTTSAGLSSRFVSRIPRTSFGKPSVALNGGYIFFPPSGPSASRLVRLSDGAYWEVGATTEHPLFVNRDYVWTTVMTDPQKWIFRRRAIPTSPPTPAER